MRIELLEDFDLLRSKGLKVNPDQLAVLLFKFEAYIEAYAAAADQLKYNRQRLENEAKEMSLFRDMLLEMKGKLHANQ